MVARLVECTDYDVIYGILTVEDVDVDTVQEKIYEIKNKFYASGFEDWTVDDVLMELPDHWVWSYEQCDNILEI